jgi:exosortase J
MTTISSATEVIQPRSFVAGKLSAPQAAGIAAILAVLGLSTVWSTVNALWFLWMTDALKSIGMFVPLVSFVLVLRAWRSLNWEMDGTWWGLAIVAVTAAVVHVRDQAIMVFVFSPQWSIYIPPHSLVAFAYGAGVVLLFGGRRLFRASLFPLVLLWFVNPVPHIFNVFVDLPLQRTSAHVARTFAIALGQPLSSDQLRLMFTPSFGMFIAPGCNGIRGAVTMGFIALITGYVYRFRWYVQTAVVVAAVLLGYVFNFARLCFLVLYYLVALKLPWLQSRAEMGDYVIGACLFLFATFLLFYVVRRLSESPGQLQPPTHDFAPIDHVVRTSFYPRFAGMLVVVLFSGYGVARGLIRTHSDSFLAQRKADESALGQFPARMGDYSLVRSWNENLYTGPLIFHWAEYAPDHEGPHISLGISPLLGSHDTLICHSARGEDPIWRDQITLPTAGGVPVRFSGSFFNSGATQYLEATTICSGDSCGEYSSDRKHFGLVYSKPTADALLSQDPQRPIPILLKAETIDTTLSPEVARRQMVSAVGNFLSSVNLSGLTRPYRR